MQDVDTLLQLGQKRQEYISQLFQKFGDWIKKRQVAVAWQDLPPLLTAVRKITGKKPRVSNDEDFFFPVSIHTGLTINEPDWDRKDPFKIRSRYWHNDFTYLQETSELVIKARGHTMVLQAGHELGDKGIIGSDCYLKDRIVARGRRNIVRYLERLSTENKLG